jgi:YVTN family beta-propeller protein
MKRTALGLFSLRSIAAVALALAWLAAPAPVLALNAYITNSGDNTVSVIDTSTNTVVATVAVGANPRGVAVTPDGTKVYVTNFGDNTVSVIGTISNAVIATIPAPKWRSRRIAAKSTLPIRIPPPSGPCP